VFEVADGHMIVAVGNDSQFMKFCEVAGRPDIASNPHYARNADRVRHRAVLVPILAALMKARTRADWLDALEAAKVPCGPINTIDQTFADEQVVSRGLLRDVLTSDDRKVKTVSNPIRFSASKNGALAASPGLGADTNVVLREILGLGAADFAALKSSGAI